MVNRFKQERGHEFGVKKIQKTKKGPPANNLSVDEDINSKNGGTCPQN
jgi:hypothetical protein